MANTYKWKVEQLDCYPQQDGLSKVVFTVHWRRQATDGEHTADIYGSQAVTLDPNAPFTPFNQLTEAMVIGWLEAAFGEEVLAAQVSALDAQIANQVNPPILRPALPWAAE